MVELVWILTPPAARVQPDAGHGDVGRDGQAYLGRRLEERLRALYPRLTRSA